MKKKIIWSVVVIIILVVSIQTFREWRDSTSVDRLVKELKEREQEIYDQKVADKIGGKTPQETLNLFIQAVEKGDYQLASKYFVVEKQEEELKSLQNSPKENIKNVMELLKQINVLEGSYSSDKREFVVRKPILVSFILYPSGNWKIEEI